MSNVWRELEVQRLQYGGYVVVNQALAGSGLMSQALAAFSDIDSALLFIKDHILQDGKTEL